MRCDSITFSGHAITRMFERGLSKNEIVNVIRNVVTAYIPSTHLWNLDFKMRK